MSVQKKEECSEEENSLPMCDPVGPCQVFFANGMIINACVDLNFSASENSAPVKTEDLLIDVLSGLTSSLAQR